jgi:hypothetical protein
MSRLTTRPIAGAEELVAHFDRVAPEYVDTHGAGDRRKTARRPPTCQYVAGGIESDKESTLLKAQPQRSPDAVHRNAGLTRC